MSGLGLRAPNRRLSKYISGGVVAGLALVVAGQASAAVVVSGTALTPPFPASIAYPGFNSFTQVSLTTQGTLDWIRVGEDATNPAFISTTGFNQKSGGGSISNYAQTGSIVADSGSNHFLSYTDAGIGAASSGGFQSDQLLSTGGFSFRAAASSSQARELDVYVETESNDAATGTFTATLRNSLGNPVAGASPYVATLSASAAVAPAVFQVDYQGAAAGDYLDVSFNRTAAGASAVNYVGLSGATLSAVPEPASLGFAATSLLLLARRRQRRD